jgi:hypothetical protein
MATGFEPSRIAELGLHRIAGELWFGPGEVESGGFAHGAATTIASDQPTADESPILGPDDHAGGRCVDTLDVTAALNICAERFGSRAEDGLDARHVGCDAADRARKAIWPTRGIDLIMEELDASEMAGGMSRLLHPVSSGTRVIARGTLFKRGEQIAAVESSHTGRFLRDLVAVDQVA